MTTGLQDSLQAGKDAPLTQEENLYQEISDLHDPPKKRTDHLIGEHEMKTKRIIKLI